LTATIFAEINLLSLLVTITSEVGALAFKDMKVHSFDDVLTVFREHLPLML
jgi:hypothetical protein